MIMNPHIAIALKAFPKEWIGGSSHVLMRAVLELVNLGVMVSCLDTFSHIA